MRDYTLGFLSLGAIPAVNVLEVAAKAGFSAAGIRLTGRSKNDAEPTIAGNPTAIKELQDTSKQLGVRISNVTTYHIRPESRIEDYLPVLEATAELGCDKIVAASYDVADDVLVDFFSEYADRANQFGIRIAIEFQPYSGIKTLGQADRIVKLAGRQNVGFLIDAFHLARSGGVPKDLSSIDPDRIYFAQICDASINTPEGMDLITEARSGRLYLGDGALPVEGLLKHLPDNVELEFEIPVVSDKDLSPEKKAQIIFDRTSGYLAGLGHVDK
ncbi:inosose isomerase [Antarctobacter heliothermus]|uniref:Inosose isomerase n=1 Tax=Antarctobacter heliothermus TaxID=74033 RepID=A0A222E6G1_9RHOB|nr:sugar phosphate isomerase/epimerase [Antarctobacter heliothermus]ASP21803.1 inosose isomerase [Antarctobacter heliothermus]